MWKIFFFVRRLTDNKILPVINETPEEVCVIEFFEFNDGGEKWRPLFLWHPKERYEILRKKID